MKRGQMGGCRGFSLVELVTAIGIGCVIAGMAAFSAQHALPELRANSARRVVEGQLNTAREMAIAQRRATEVEFLPPNEVRVTRIETNGIRTEISRAYFEGGAQFLQFSGVPDTPDGFGNMTPVAFNNASQTLFLSDGSFVDQSGQPTSGTVSLGIPNRQTTARAVTVFGGTGRVAGYRWSGTAWYR